MVMNNSDFLNDVEELRRNRIIVNDVEVVAATGFSAPMVSLYMSGKRPASKQFLKKFYETYENKLQINIYKNSENLTPVIKNPDADHKTKPKNNRLKETTAIPLAPGKLMYVKLVNQYAYAGYLNGYGDQEYLDELPRLPWLVDKEYKGNYLCFEVSGDSMDDGTSDSYKHGDVVLTREIQQDHWRNQLHIKDWDFVIVHDDSVVIKKIVAHDTATGEITLHSLNPIYEDFTINLSTVKMLFNVIKHTRNK